MNCKTLSIFLILCSSLATCQAKIEKKQINQKTKIEIDSIDLEIFNTLQHILKNVPFDSITTGEKIIEIGKLFLQTRYVGGTLENNDKEELIINLHQLDCTTYLENVLALFQSLKKPQTMISDFYKNIELIRYQGGKRTNYTSRLHYFSEWIIDNEKKGLITDISQQIGGEPYLKTVNFMSTHISSYSALTRDSSLIKEIKKTEQILNLHENFYIPKTKIKNLENQIHNGDFIAITSKIKGLDVSHTGIAIFLNKQLHLMHASSKAKKVLISDIPLVDMLQNNGLQTGIKVLRIK